MTNEVRYYLTVIRDAMKPLTDEERADSLFNHARDPEARMEERVVYVPTHIVTVVQLPTKSKEIAINTEQIADKIDYILEAYDENMRLKTNQDVVMLNILVV